MAKKKHHMPSRNQIAHALGMEDVRTRTGRKVQGASKQQLKMWAEKNLDGDEAE